MYFVLIILGILVCYYKRKMLNMDVVIIGIGEFANMIAEFIEKYDKKKVIAFSLNKDYIKDEFAYGKRVVAYEDLKQYFDVDKIELVIAVGYKKMNDIRKKFTEQILNDGYKLANFIHPSAFVASSAKIKQGNIILESAIISENVIIGNSNIIWNGCNISHNCIIGDYNYLAPSVTMGGCVSIKSNCFFGLSSIILSGKKIESYTLAGAGSYIANDTEEYSVYVPQRSIKLEGKTPYDFKYIN